METRVNKSTKKARSKTLTEIGGSRATACMGSLYDRTAFYEDMRKKNARKHRKVGK